MVSQAGSEEQLDTHQADAALVERLCAAQEQAHIASCCADFATSLGARYFDFVLMPPALALPSEPIFRQTNLPASWLELYASRSLSHVDPVLRCHQYSMAPAFWDDLSLRYLSGHEREFLQAATAHGLDTALTTPLAGRSGGIARLTIAAIAITGDAGHRRTVLAMRTRTMAAYVHDAALRLTPWRQGLLSDREKDVLTVAAAPSYEENGNRHGYTTKQIGMILRISERTVLFHIATASRKMHEHGRHRTIRAAVQTGELDIEQHASDKGLSHLFAPRGARPIESAPPLDQIVEVDPAVVLRSKHDLPRPGRQG